MRRCPRDGKAAARVLQLSPTFGVGPTRPEVPRSTVTNLEESWSIDDLDERVCGWSPSSAERRRSQAAVSLHKTS